jgi:3-dehydroquinate synthase
MEDSQMSKGFTVQSKVRDTYEVSFIDDLQGHLSSLGSDKNLIFVIDKKVSDLFSEELSSLWVSKTIFIDSSEENKTIDFCQDVIRQLIIHNVRKNDTLVAVGGGITQDIVTFIASILYRGVDWKFYPTTLLAQCDSCIGSKSSINFDQIKNLIGTFNPPSEIFIYVGFLNTLTESEVRSGIGEMMHYFLSEGIELAEQISNKIPELIEKRDHLLFFIENSLRIKKKIIEIDEFDNSIRHIFNYGHTFGHAIEAITKYGIPHGQAITIGMDLANYISWQKGMINQSVFFQLHELLHLNMLPFSFTSENIVPYFAALSRDKKNKGNQLGCILTRGPGKLEKSFLNIDDELKKIIFTYSETFLTADPN